MKKKQRAIRSGVSETLATRSEFLEADQRIGDALQRRLDGAENVNECRELIRAHQNAYVRYLCRILVTTELLPAEPAAD